MTHTIKRVMVTGGSGRIGQYVLAELAPHYEIINADLCKNQGGIAEFVQLDVMDLAALREQLRGIDAVVHLAAIDYDWKAEPERYIDVNVRGTWHVLQASAEAGVGKVVLCSSISACGLSEMRRDWRPQYLQVDELHECRPVQAYSVSKLLMEEMALSFARGSSMDVLCLRPMAVVMQESFASFLEFIEGPECNWLFYYVTAFDVARAFRAALEARLLHFGTFFLTAEDTCRTEATCDWYRARFGELPEIRNPRLFQRLPRASIFSHLKARELLGWEPTSSFPALRERWTPKKRESP